MATILVTGGAGFIGSHTCKALARVGHRPVTLDNLERGHKWAVKWGPFVHADLRDEHSIRRTFDEWRPSAVIHFAAYAYVGESSVEPVKYYDTNVGGTAKLLAACISAGCKNVVFSSSCATYGIPAKLPLTEIDPQVPINPYGFSKLVVERMLRDAEMAHGMRYVNLRYFNAAGADPDGDLGELHTPETHLIPLVLLAALRGDTVKIFGQDYSTPDGTCIRDYVHVTDLAYAHVAAVEWLAAGRPSTSFNLGNGHGFSVNQVVLTARRLTRRPIKTEICSRRPGDPPVLISDSTKAHQELGWRPKFPTLDLQIDHAWTWFRDLMPSPDSGTT